MRFDVAKQNLTSVHEKPTNVSLEPAVHESIRPIFDLSETSFYEKGQVVFAEDKIARGLYYVHFGKIKEYKQGSDGKEQIIRLCKAGDFLGYKSLLTGNCRSTISAEVMEGGALSYLPREDFMRLIGSDHKILFYFSRLMAQELENVENKVVGMAYKPVRGRLAEVLLALNHFYDDRPVEVKANIKHCISVSREDLASMVGTVKETVIRLLSEFRSEGMIETQGKSIAILNPDGLLRIDKMYR